MWPLFLDRSSEFSLSSVADPFRISAHQSKTLSPVEGCHQRSPVAKRTQEENGQTAQYAYRPLPRPINRYYFATQRPELHWHTFGPKTNFDRDYQAVYVFQREPVGQTMNDER